MELQNLKTNHLGRNVIFYESIDSTQLEMWRRVKNNNVKDGDLILAEMQTKGIRNSWKKMVHR